MRLWLPFAFAGSLTVISCGETVQVGDDRNAEQILQEERLAKLALDLAGKWHTRRLPFGATVSFTFTPALNAPKSGSVEADYPLRLFAALWPRDGGAEGADPGLTPDPGVSTFWLYGYDGRYVLGSIVDEQGFSLPLYVTPDPTGQRVQGLAVFSEVGELVRQ